MTEFEHIQESSQYLATLLRRDPTLKEWLYDQKNLYRRYPLTGLYQDLQAAVSDVESFEQLQRLFRAFKQRHFLRIGGRDLLGLATLSETTSQLSDLACVTLQTGLDALWNHPERWAGPEELDAWSMIGRDTGLAVLGFGKLGGSELNYVSDIDLLFLHSSPGVAEAPEPSGAPMLFSMLGQKLSRLMMDMVEGDRVFNVDHRLRPGGKDGALVPSLSSASEYYMNMGRAWERQALLKVRPVAGDRSLGMAFIQEVRPFVFRRFLDFQALDELKAMRDRILKEAVKPRSGWREFDVKLGIGGIREVEFLVQSLQLIYGGRHPQLDEPNTLKCLERLRELDLLPTKAKEELTECYTFLRRVEHWVQLDQNRQTQELPRSTEAQTRLSLAMGFDRNVEAFLVRLAECCETVHRHFLELFHSEANHRVESEAGVAGGEDQAPSEGDFLDYFPEESLSRLNKHIDGFPPVIRRAVLGALQPFGRAGKAEVAEKALLRLERYFGQVTRRPGLLKVFHSSGAWLEDFCRGLVQSELLSDLLCHHPSLVEGVATSAELCPPTDVWEKNSLRLLGRSADFEEGLEWLRRLKNERIVQVALADLRGDLDCGEIELRLSDLADFVIRRTYERILDNLGIERDLPLCVLALGKLGSREMSYLSDLDLVFVYNPRPGEPDDRTPPETFRLIQRFMRMLSTPLHEGPGYAVDARLRPTGTFGPLIVTRNSWERYYTSEADIWEVQALLRARCVAGDPELGRWIEERSREVCYKQREDSEVWPRLCHLRGRMQRERAEEGPESLDIKLGAGGLVDVEFLVQGNLLLRGGDDPALRDPSVRSALEPVLDGLTGPESFRRELTTAFGALRALDHRLRLHANATTARLALHQFESLKAVGLWPPRQEGGSIESWEDILRLRRIVRASLKRFCPDL